MTKHFKEQLGQELCHRVRAFVQSDPATSSNTYQSYSGFFMPGIQNPLHRVNVFQVY